MTKAKVKKKVARRSSRPTTAEDVLRIVRKFLEYDSSNVTLFHEQRKLLAVLTALRGPDFESEVKAATTGVIRDAALGSKTCRNFGLVSGPDRPEYEDYRDALPRGHFRVHALRAFTALGLEWSARTPPEKKS